MNLVTPPPLSRSGLTLRELEVLRALIHSGTTRAAADRLGISQPAVSRAVAQLEARLKRLLFRREGGRLVPLPEALAVDAELDPLFAALGRIEHAAMRAADPAVPLRIAAPPTLAHRFLPGAVGDFMRANPGVPINVDVLSSDVLVTQVAEGRVDAALSDVEPSHAGVRIEPFRTTEAVCMMPRGHPLAARDWIAPADLEGADFIALTRRHTARVAVDAVLAAAGVRCRIVIETATSVSAAEYVREGLGLTLVNPFPVAWRPDPAVVVRPFRPGIPLRSSFLLPNGVRPGAATLAFMACVRARAGADR